MKITKASSLFLLILVLYFFSCSKSNNNTQTPTPGISDLSGTWICSHWVDAGDTLEITFNTSAKNATDTYMNPENFGYTVGDVIITTIATTSTAGTFTCIAEVRSGSNNSVLSSGSIHLVLLNNVLTVKYSDISGYGDLTFVKK